MKLLRVDASPKGEKSNSRMLADEFVSHIKRDFPALEIDHLDLAEQTPAHVTAAFAKATYTPASERTAEMKATLEPSDALCARLLAADALLFSMPMYNWSMPSTFKAFVDAIVRTDLTYGFTPDGGTEGYLQQDKVLIITTRGANQGPGSPYAGMDALTPALRAVFGFLGIADPDIVNAEPMQFANPEERAAGLAKARESLRRVAGKWALRQEAA
ncbi:MAG: FMN-dependent NADH-azoreductase [Hyphomicrobiaceae bacterium]